MLYKIIIILIAIIGLVFVFKSRRTSRSTSNQNSSHANIPNAFRKKTSGLTVNEQSLLKHLQALVAGKNIVVFTKPQLTTFIALDPTLAPEIQARLEESLKQISCDFILVNQQTFSPIVVLSVEPSQSLQKLMSDLNLPLIPLHAQKSYDEVQLQQLLTHYLW